MPRLANIRCIHNALAVGRNIGARFPVRFFVMDLLGLGSRLDLHTPEATCAMNSPAIRNEENFSPIARPYRTYLVIHFAVVVTGKGTHIFRSQLARVGK